jgi:hypothetical protein
VNGWVEDDGGNGICIARKDAIIAAISGSFYRYVYETYL